MYSSQCRTEAWLSKQAGASKIHGISMSVRMVRIFATRNYADQVVYPYPFLVGWGVVFEAVPVWA